jgi:photosystem II stability/assembly factor-like uncharacterized protein
LTPNGLVISTDGGNSWKEITPPGVAPSVIKGVVFEDAEHGWVAASSQPSGSVYATVIVYRTDDAGSSWQPTQVTQPSPELTDSVGAPAYLDFISASDGWLMLQLTSSSAFSIGQLFVTRDAGATWSRETIPIGGEISFIDDHDGWTAGGPAGDQLFVTHDGGRTWSPERPTLPGGVDPLNVGYDIPTQMADGQTILPVTIDGPSSRLIWYISDDHGQSWTGHATADSHQDLERGQRFATGVSPAGALVAELGQDKQVDVANSRSTAHSHHAPQGLPLGPDAAISRLTFADDEHGWALLQGSYCAKFKADCHNYSTLFTTTDAGADWTQLTP